MENPTLHRAALCFLFIFNSCYAADTEVEDSQPRARIKMEIPSEDEELVGQLLENLKSAIDQQNFKSYLSLTTKEFASKNKKKTAIMFLENSLSVDLGKFAIMESSNDAIEFMTSYTLTVNADSTQIVSLIVAKKTDDGLLLSKEEVISNKSIAGEEGEVFLTRKRQQVCLDGNCQLPQNKQEVKKGDGIIHLFRNEKGEPDINGIMWLDPKDLLRAFPEKYHGCRKCVGQ